MKEKAQRVQDGAGQDSAPDSGAQSLPLRYVNAHYTIVGVPARDLSADEARRYGAKIAAVQAASSIMIYQEVEP